MTQEQKASVTKYGGLESEHVTQDRVERESSEPDPSLLWRVARKYSCFWQVAAKLSPGSKLVLLEQPLASFLPSQEGSASPSPSPSQHKCFPWSP